MKRPKGIYFVAAWFFIVAIFQMSPIGKMSKAYTAQGAPVPQWLGLLTLAAFGFTIYVMVGLIQLRAFSRWFCVSLLAVWTNYMAWKLVVAGFRFLPLVLAITALNAVVMWYLCRPAFIETCRQFRKECDRERMEKYAAKQIAKLRGKEIL